MVAFIRFLLGSFISPGAFGRSRWFSACVDIVTLPALLPLAVCVLFTRLRLLAGTANYANFALLWLIPGAAMRAVNWSALNDPSLLVMTPVLWTAIAVGIPFFVTMSGKFHRRLIVLRALAIAVLPFLAATVYWAFFSQHTPWGFLLLFVTLIPMGVSIILSMIRNAE
jgi:hypothetical protein